MISLEQISNLKKHSKATWEEGLHLESNPNQNTQRKKGHVKDSFKQKHNPLSTSKPWDFAEAFLLYLQDKKDPNQTFSFDLVKQWMNLKADLAGARKRCTRTNDNLLRLTKSVNMLDRMCCMGSCRLPGLSKNFSHKERITLKGMILFTYCLDQTLSADTKNSNVVPRSRYYYTKQGSVS